MNINRITVDIRSSSFILPPPPPSSTTTLHPNSPPIARRHKVTSPSPLRRDVGKFERAQRGIWDQGDARVGAQGTSRNDARLSSCVVSLVLSPIPPLTILELPPSSTPPRQPTTTFPSNPVADRRTDHHRLEKRERRRNSMSTSQSRSLAGEPTAIASKNAKEDVLSPPPTCQATQRGRIHAGSS
jgi:hypothetical protein